MKRRTYITTSVLPTAFRQAVLFVCLFFFTSCGNLYTGEEDLFNPDVDPDALEESVPVMVAFSDPYYNILSTSRGVGKVDPQDTCFIDKMNPVDKDGKPLVDEQPRFFIYAFRKNYPYYITRADDSKACLVDGSCGMQASYATNHKNDKDTPQTNPQDKYMEGHGKWAHYNGHGSFVSWRFFDDKLYYPNGRNDQDISYDFFAYYHDGAACGEIDRGEDRISFPIKIDGSQDLMCGAAELTPEQLETISLMENEEEKQRINEFHYSAFSGRRNIWPIFRMSHQLAYIKIILKAGNAYGDPVYVHDLKMEMFTQGIFVVVDKDKNLGVTFDNTKPTEILPLRNVVDGRPILKDSDDPNADTWKKRALYLQHNEDGTSPLPLVVGEMLIPPGKGYLRLHTGLSNKDTDWREDNTVRGIDNEFVAGKTYNLNVTVYGPTDFRLDVEAAPWQEGGDVEVDTEEEGSKG